MKQNIFPKGFVVIDRPKANNSHTKVIKAANPRLPTSDAVNFFFLGRVTTYRATF